MALKFGPQWLRDLTDVGAGVAQPQSPSSGVKFKLADYRYGREEMLALYSEHYAAPEQVRKHQAIFSKDNQRPISLNPFSEDEQRLISQGINSHIVLRTGGRGGISDRGRGRGRGRGESNYISRQPENGDQPFGRQANDGWEQVGRKPVERSFSRGFDEQAAPQKREFLRSSSNNWRDKKEGDKNEEQESNSGGVQWRPRETPRENTNRWGSNRANWRQPPPEFEDARPQKRDLDSDQRGPRKISDSYENDVPEWAADDVGDDPGTFDSKGVFVSNRMGGREFHSQDHHSRKKFDKQHIIEKRESSQKSEHERPNLKEKKKTISSPETEPLHQPPINKLPEKPQSTATPDYSGDPVPKHHLTDIITNSMKGDGDSVNCGLPFLDKGPNTQQGPMGPNDRPETFYHPHSLTEENMKRVDTNMDGDHAARVAKMAESENLLRMEKSLQNLIAGMNANTETKAEEEIDVSTGALPLSHKDANKWFYRDPQGQIQGPFNSESMAEWFKIGYFTMSLIVKRGCDDSFKPLGELIKQYGRVPFGPGPPLPPIITKTSQPEEVVPPEVPVTPPVMTMPSLVSPMMPGGMMGHAMPSLHDRFLFRSMMLQQEYLKQTLLMQQLQMQTLAKLQEQENFKDYTPDQQHEIATRMMMQNNPLLMQQMQQIQHQQLLLQQEQQQQQQQQQQHRPELHHPHAQGGISMDGGAVTSVPFQQPISHPSMSMHNVNNNPIPTTTLQNSTSVANEKETVWANSQHTENSIWSQPSSMWDIDNTSETSQAYKIQMEKLKREREEESQREERIQQELLENKQKEIRLQQNELEKQREQVRREKEELERERLRKMEEVRKEEERLLQLEIERKEKERMEQDTRKKAQERKQGEDRKKREQELKKQEDKRRKEEEKLMLEERKRQEEARHKKEQEEMRRRAELEAIEAKQKEELRREMELKQIQEEEERMQREAVEKDKQLATIKKQQIEFQRQQESLRKLQQAQKEQLANIQLPASSNWANNGSQGGAVHSKSLTEIQVEEAMKEKERQREVQLQRERMQEQAVVIQQQQIQNQKTWAAQTGARGAPGRGLSLLEIQNQEKENAKKSDKGKPQNHQAKPSLGSGGNFLGSAGPGLWGTNTNWEGNASPASTTSIWDMGVPQSIKKPQLGKNSLGSGQNAQQSKKNSKTNKKAAAPSVQKEVETVQKLFQNKKQDGFSAWVSDKLSKFSSNIDVPTFVSFIVDVDSPDDVLDYVKTYLGDNKETHDFTYQFLEKRNQYKNQMRLQKQLEEDSIWGPAPAINPHSTIPPTFEASKSANGESGQVKSKGKKKKKAQKLDVSILGFTVHADPNRKNAGELETIE